MGLLTRRCTPSTHSDPSPFATSPLKPPANDSTGLIAGALPFSSFIRPISRRFGYIPLRAIWACACAAAIIGLLTLIAPAAGQAVFSLAITGNNVAWGVPILSRVLWGQAKFKPGPFYTGDKFSVPIAWTAVTFLVFGVLLAMFPSDPHPSLQNMNYSVVISLSVWLGAVGYYFVHARKWFTGPKTTVSISSSAAAADDHDGHHGLLLRSYSDNQSDDEDLNDVIPTLTSDSPTRRVSMGMGLGMGGAQEYTRVKKSKVHPSTTQKLS